MIKSDRHANGVFNTAGILYRDGGVVVSGTIYDKAWRIFFSMETSIGEPDMIYAAPKQSWWEKNVTQPIRRYKATDKGATNMAFLELASYAIGGEFIGAGFRAIRAAKGVTNLIPEGKLANHLFKGAGKLADNPANRSLIQNLANSKALGVDAFGKSWHMGLDGAGKSIYTYTQNGVVKGAGYATMTAEQMILKYGLK